MPVETEPKISIPTTPEEIAAARQRIVDVARSWLLTPYRPGACRKGIGCDCGSFLAGVFAEARLIPPQKLVKYDTAAAWAVRGGDEFYISSIAKFMHPISPEQVKPGDLVMYRLGRGWSHTGIIERWPGIVIHALAGGVIASPGTTGRLAGRAMRFWSFF